MMSSASKPGDLEDRDAERLDHLAHQPHLLAEDVGRRVAVGLVGRRPARGGTSARAGRRPPRCRRAGGRWRRLIEHRREPEHRVGDLPRRGGQVGGQGEEGAVGERVAVDQEDGARHRCRLGLGRQVARDHLVGDRAHRAPLLHRPLLDEREGVGLARARGRPSGGPWPGRRPCGSRAAPRGSCSGRTAPASPGSGRAPPRPPGSAPTAGTASPGRRARRRRGPAR